MVILKFIRYASRNIKYIKKRKRIFTRKYLTSFKYRLDYYFYRNTNNMNNKKINFSIFNYKKNNSTKKNDSI